MRVIVVFLVTLLVIGTTTQQVTQSTCDDIVNIRRCQEGSGFYKINAISSDVEVEGTASLYTVVDVDIMMYDFIAPDCIIHETLYYTALDSDGTNCEFVGCSPADPTTTPCYLMSPPLQIDLDITGTMYYTTMTDLPSTDAPFDVVERTSLTQYPDNQFDQEQYIDDDALDDPSQNLQTLRNSRICLSYNYYTFTDRDDYYFQCSGGGQWFGQYDDDSCIYDDTVDDDYQFAILENFDSPFEPEDLYCSNDAYLTVDDDTVHVIKTHCHAGGYPMACDSHQSILTNDCFNPIEDIIDNGSITFDYDDAREDIMFYSSKNFVDKGSQSYSCHNPFKATDNYIPNPNSECDFAGDDEDGYAPRALNFDNYIVNIGGVNSVLTPQAYYSLTSDITVDYPVQTSYSTTAQEDHMVYPLITNRLPFDSGVIISDAADGFYIPQTSTSMPLTSDQFAKASQVFTQGVSQSDGKQQYGSSFPELENLPPVVSSDGIIQTATCGYSIIGEAHQNCSQATILSATRYYQNSVDLPMIYASNNKGVLTTLAAGADIKISYLDVYNNPFLLYDTGNVTISYNSDVTFSSDPTDPNASIMIDATLSSPRSDYANAIGGFPRMPRLVQDDFYDLFSYDPVYTNPFFESDCIGCPPTRQFNPEEYLLPFYIGETASDDDFEEINRLSGYSDSIVPEMYSTDNGDPTVKEMCGSNDGLTRGRYNPPNPLTGEAYPATIMAFQEQEYSLFLQYADCLRSQPAFETSVFTVIAACENLYAKLNTDTNYGMIDEYDPFRYPNSWLIALDVDTGQNRCTAGINSPECELSEIFEWEYATTYYPHNTHHPLTDLDIEALIEQEGETEFWNSLLQDAQVQNMKMYINQDDVSAPVKQISTFTLEFTNTECPDVASNYIYCSETDSEFCIESDINVISQQGLASQGDLYRLVLFDCETLVPLCDQSACNTNDGSATCTQGDQFPECECCKLFGGFEQQSDGSTYNSAFDFNLNELYSNILDSQFRIVSNIKFQLNVNGYEDFYNRVNILDLGDDLKKTCSAKLQLVQSNYDDGSAFVTIPASSETRTRDNTVPQCYIFDNDVFYDAPGSIQASPDASPLPSASSTPSTLVGVTPSTTPVLQPTVILYDDDDTAYYDDNTYYQTQEYLDSTLYVDPVVDQDSLDTVMLTPSPTPSVSSSVTDEDSSFALFAECGDFQHGIINGCTVGVALVIAALCLLTTCCGIGVCAYKRLNSKQYEVDYMPETQYDLNDDFIQPHPSKNRS